VDRDFLSEVEARQVEVRRGLPRDAVLGTDADAGRGGDGDPPVAPQSPPTAAFACAATSPMLAIACPTLAGAAGRAGLLTCRRTLPVPWARCGGLDTFRARSGAPPTFAGDIAGARAALDAEVHALACEAARATATAARDTAAAHAHAHALPATELVRALVLARQRGLDRVASANAAADLTAAQVLRGLVAKRPLGGITPGPHPCRGRGWHLLRSGPT